MVCKCHPRIHGRLLHSISRSILRNTASGCSSSAMKHAQSVSDTATFTASVDMTGFVEKVYYGFVEKVYYAFVEKVYCGFVEKVYNKHRAM